MRRENRRETTPTRPDPRPPIDSRFHHRSRASRGVHSERLTAVWRNCIGDRHRPDRRPRPDITWTRRTARDLFSTEAGDDTPNNPQMTIECRKTATLPARKPPRTPHSATISDPWRIGCSAHASTSSATSPRREGSVVSPRSDLLTGTDNAASVGNLYTPTIPNTARPLGTESTDLPGPSASTRKANPNSCPRHRQEAESYYRRF